MKDECTENEITVLTDELTTIDELAKVLDTETFIQPPLPNIDEYDLTPLQLNIYNRK